ncbi:MAG TPA: hypothetical protein VEA59_07210 [Patescibacteria group bacterium]|nr:hypothetical protein [Patescibacteria group bacterium]
MPIIERFSWSVKQELPHFGIPFDLHFQSFNSESPPYDLIPPGYKVLVWKRLHNALKIDFKIMIKEEAIAFVSKPANSAWSIAVPLEIYLSWLRATFAKE